jgi:hypothetical protein
MTSTHKGTFASIDEAQAEVAWAEMKKLPAFGYKDVSSLARITVEKASRIVRHWDRCGVLEMTQARRGKQRALWRIMPGATRPQVPVGRTVEDNIWTSMRHLGSFTPTDLQAHSNTGTVVVSLDETAAYCRALLAAGYLRVNRKAVPGRNEATYRLIENTGPRPPRERRVRAIVDPNTETVTVISGAGQ